MSAAEFAEWQVFFEKHPLPDHNLNMAQLCSLTANLHGNNTTTEDFLPRVEKIKHKPAGDRPTPEESAGILGRKYRENEAAAIKRIAIGG